MTPGIDPFLAKRREASDVAESRARRFRSGAALFDHAPYETGRARAHAFLPVLRFVGLDDVVAVSDLRPVSDVALFLELFNGRFYGFGS